MRTVLRPVDGSLQSRPLPGREGRGVVGCDGPVACRISGFRSASLTDGDADRIEASRGDLRASARLGRLLAHLLEVVLSDERLPVRVELGRRSLGAVELAEGALVDDGVRSGRVKEACLISDGAS